MISYSSIIDIISKEGVYPEISLLMYHDWEFVQFIRMNGGVTGNKVYQYNVNSPIQIYRHYQYATDPLLSNLDEAFVIVKVKRKQYEALKELMKMGGRGYPLLYEEE